MVCLLPLFLFICFNVHISRATPPEWFSRRFAFIAHILGHAKEKGTLSAACELEHTHQHKRSVFHVFQWFYWVFMCFGGVWWFCWSCLTSDCGDCVLKPLKPHFSCASWSVQFHFIRRHSRVSCIHILTYSHQSRVCLCAREKQVYLHSEVAFSFSFCSCCFF